MDGESDFVVAHRDYGVLFIEVKGGAISYDPSEDRWRSTDRYGIRHRIKNPVKQASDSKHALLAKVREERGWPHAFIRFRHGVVFPDVTSVPKSMGPDKPRELFATRVDLECIEEWLVQRLSGGNEKPLGQQGLDVLIRLLARPIQLHSPLSFSCADDDDAIENLTPQQYHILTAFGDLRRVAVSGGAGTGKTVLACEDARRLADMGMRTLLTCGSSRLADYLRGVLRGSAVEVDTFAGVAKRLSKEAGLVTFGATQAVDGLAEAVFDSLAARPDLAYDAVVVDEAQDFTPATWVAIDSLATRSEESVLHAYFDSNQRVYGELRSQFDCYSLLPIRLSRNLRNTQNIHDVTQQFYRGPSLVADGPVGVEVNWIVCHEHAIVRGACDEVRRLVVGEAVGPLDIAVLTTSPELSRQLSERLSDEIYMGLMISSVSDFKGLERRFVLVLATREIAEFPELAYVALSRGRTYLAVIGASTLLTWLKAPGGGASLPATVAPDTLAE